MPALRRSARDPCSKVCFLRIPADIPCVSAHRPRFLLAVIVALTVSSAGCVFQNANSSTSPDSISLATLLGTWTSANGVTTSFPTAQACGNFQWTVTNQSGQTASGTFSATCAGGITLNGTASGTLNGSSVDWTATGQATESGLPGCPFSLSGTATLTNSTTLSIPYSGTTCFGPVSGTETLTKK